MLFSSLSDQEAGNFAESNVLSSIRKHSSISHITPFADTRSASSGGAVKIINPVPSDHIVTLLGGNSLYIEVKASRKHESIYTAIKGVRNVQAATARRIGKLRGSYVFVFIDRVNHLFHVYSGTEVADYFYRTSSYEKPPIISGHWVDRDKLTLSLLEGFI